MHIIAHNGSPIYGGGEIWLARLLAGLQERGHRVMMYCKNSDVSGRAAACGIPTAVMALGGDLMAPHALLFARALNRQRPDALILTTFKKIWLGGLAAHLARVPFVIARVAVTGLEARNWTYRHALRHWVDCVVANGEEMHQAFVSRLPRGTHPEVRVITDGIAAPAAPAEADLRRELGLPPKALVIGSVARLSRQKRLDRLVEALARLPASVHAVVAGEGPLRGEILATASRCRVNDRLHLVGFRNNVGDVLRALDVFVLTSDFEGLSGAMLEAMAAGLPVVSTPVSGAAEALAAPPGGPAGLVVGFEVDEIVRGLAMVLGDRALRRSLGAAGTERVNARFGFTRMIDQWEALLLRGCQRGEAAACAS